LPKEKSLTKKGYRFCQERKFNQEDIGFAKRKKNLAKKNMEVFPKIKV
jgi:hypothetical protein